MTEYAGSLSGLQSAALWACALVAAGVFASLIHSIATFRRPAEDTKRQRSSTAEVFWALVPLIIVAATAAPAVTDMLGTGAATGTNETARQTAPVAGPELAGEIPRKPFQEGPVPL